MFEMNNNKVTIIGEVGKEFKFDHEVYGEKFYTTEVVVKRLSSYEDRIAVIVSDRLLDMSQDYTGKHIMINGEFRSFNKLIGENKKKLLLFVFAKEVELVDGSSADLTSNTIELTGYLCKKPIYRETPKKREIADICLAVNRSYSKADYIPCICWGRTAKFISKFETGTLVNVTGRIQSRNYTKILSETESAEYTVYEVSVIGLEVVNNNLED